MDGNFETTWRKVYSLFSEMPLDYKDREKLKPLIKQMHDYFEDYIKDLNEEIKNRSEYDLGWSDGYNSCLKNKKNETP